VRGQLIQRLSWRVVLEFTCAGHRATDARAARECTIERYGADVAALLANLELSKAILVGHSMGCRVVLEAAPAGSGAHSGIVLVDGSRMSGGVAPESAGYVASRTAFWPDVREFLARSKAIIARAKRMPPIPPLRHSVAAALGCGKAGSGARRRARPLMVIQSTWITPSAARFPEGGADVALARALRQRVPGARIEVVPGVGHFTQLEAAPSVNRLIAKPSISRCT